MHRPGRSSSSSVLTAVVLPQPGWPVTSTQSVLVCDEYGSMLALVRLTAMSTASLVGEHLSPAATCHDLWSWLKCMHTAVQAARMSCSRRLRAARRMPALPAQQQREQRLQAQQSARRHMRSRSTRRYGQRAPVREPCRHRLNARGRDSPRCAAHPRPQDSQQMTHRRGWLVVVAGHAAAEPEEACTPAVLPVLDLAPFAGGDDDAQRTVARALDAACRDHGFVALRNVGVDRALLAAAGTRPRAASRSRPRRALSRGRRRRTGAISPPGRERPTRDGRRASWKEAFQPKARATSTTRRLLLFGEPSPTSCGASWSWRLPTGTRSRPPWRSTYPRLLLQDAPTARPLHAAVPALPRAALGRRRRGPPRGRAHGLWLRDVPG